MMLTAITRSVSPALDSCELEFLERRPIDISKAAEQHRVYKQCLRDAGARVITLPTDAQFPDCVFVEDPAIVLDEVAIMTRTGALSRRGEGQAIAEALAPFRELARIAEPGTLEGGDVMRLGKTLFVGRSRRTNDEGIAQLSAIAEPLGYRVVAVEVKGCLHLKSACSSLDDGTILANRELLESGAFEGFRVVDVPREEPFAANVLRVADTILNAASFPKTAEMLDRLRYKIRMVDISELQKAEAALTCSCLLFDDLMSR